VRNAIRGDGIQYETIDGKHEENLTEILGRLNTPRAHGVILSLVGRGIGLVKGEEKSDIITSVQDISDRFLGEVTDLGLGSIFIYGKRRDHSLCCSLPAVALSDSSQ
jgi:hypothetical protein